MPTKIELLPCPFCDGKARIKSAKYNTLGMYGGGETENQWWAVGCTKCKISQLIRQYFSRDDAVKAWNTRAYDKNAEKWES